MKNKFLLIVIAICLITSCAVFTTACSPEGVDEEVDPTLYSVKLTVEDGIFAKLSPAQKNELLAVFGGGENLDGTRDDDFLLTEAGATEEDIAKAGTFDETKGCYYFFAGDPVYLLAPQVSCYEIKGVYLKGTDKKVFNLTYNQELTFQNNKNAKVEDGTPRPDYRFWLNQADIELSAETPVELEVRYAAIEYDVAYVDFDTLAPVTTANPTTYKVTDGSVSLECDVEPKDGCSFAWTLDGEEQITDLADFDYAGLPDGKTSIVIYATSIESPKPSFTVTVSVTGLKEGTDDCITVHSPFFKSFWPEDGANQEEYLTVTEGVDNEITVDLDSFGRYDVSFFANDEEITEGIENEGNVYQLDYTVSSNVTIEIRLTAKE